MASMQTPAEIPDHIRSRLSETYEEIMWLAHRPNVTPTAARAWYTHIAHLTVRRDIRQFTGKVSLEAANDSQAVLRLEHFKRIQNTLTKLVAEHIARDIRDAEEFITTLINCELVHLVTAPQNYDAMKARGNYSEAGIVLLDWSEVPKERRAFIWQKVLKGKVANAQLFRVEP
jgi:hypothetical protein